VSDRSCLVVMYHYVRDTADTPFPAIRALPVDLFSRQLDWLESGYAVITADEIEQTLDRGGSLPVNASLLTFDDGFVDHFAAVYPRLRARGLSGVFFLTEDACCDHPRLLGVHKTHFLMAQLGAEAFGRAVLAECASAARAESGDRNVFGADAWEAADERAIKHLLNYQLPFGEADRVLDALFARHVGDAEAFARQLYLSAGMIREMSAGGMCFGYHTRSHRMLSRLSVAEQAAELENGVAWIRQLTGQARVPFCYPWGGAGTYTPDTVRLLGDLGYSVAFNTERRQVRLDSDPRFELPRLDTRDLPPYTDGENGAVRTS
jgi:peptidoglycan/xylan/chitin deacetylase (PgdA/CDA1 family)